MKEETVLRIFEKDELYPVFVPTEPSANQPRRPGVMVPKAKLQEWEAKQDAWEEAQHEMGKYYDKEWEAQS